MIPFVIHTLAIQTIGRYKLEHLTFQAEPHECTRTQIEQFSCWNPVSTHVTKWGLSSRRNCDLGCSRSCRLRRWWWGWCRESIIWSKQSRSRGLTPTRVTRKFHVWVWRWFRKPWSNRAFFVVLVLDNSFVNKWNKTLHCCRIENEKQREENRGKQRKWKVLVCELDWRWEEKKGLLGLNLRCGRVYLSDVE